MGQNYRYRKALYGRCVPLSSWGFGVHSPFAYRLITEVVVSPGYRFYGELPYVNNPLAALFYRLGASYPIRAIRIPESAPTCFGEVARSLQSFVGQSPAEHLAGPFAEEECFELCLCSEDDFVLEERDFSPFSLLLLLNKKHRATAEALLDVWGRGILLPLKEATLVVLNPNLSKAVYS